MVGVDLGVTLLGDHQPYGVDHEVGDLNQRLRVGKGLDEGNDRVYLRYKV